MTTLVKQTLGRLALVLLLLLMSAPVGHRAAYAGDPTLGKGLP